jgi:hypothetical protein
MDFTQRRNYINHYDSLHLKLKKYSCTICKAEFGYQNSLEDHVKFFHEGMSRYKCPLCKRTDGYTYKLLRSEEKFKTHMKNEHGIDDIDANIYAYKAQSDCAPRRGRKKAN